jgi:hypothetical protein
MDGFAEYYTDYFHVSSYPLPSLEGFLNNISWVSTPSMGSQPGFILTKW